MTDSALTPLLVHICFSIVVSLPCPGFPVVRFPDKKKKRSGKRSLVTKIPSNFEPKAGIPADCSGRDRVGEEAGRRSYKMLISLSDALGQWGLRHGW
jgi:hypothetical protein